MHTAAAFALDTIEINASPHLVSVLPASHWIHVVEVNNDLGMVFETGWFSSQATHPRQR